MSKFKILGNEGQSMVKTDRPCRESKKDVKTRLKRATYKLELLLAVSEAGIDIDYKALDAAIGCAYKYKAQIKRELNSYG